MTEHLPECPVWRCCKPDEKATMHMCICSDEERVGGLITRKIAEKIGRNIGQYGCVIPEQQHLPECPCEPCICSYLRACEERVRSNPDWTSHVLLDELERCLALAYKEGLGTGSDEHGQHEIGWIKGYDAALDAALEAVAGINGKWVFGPRIYKHEALTAIRLIKGDQP